MQFWTFVEVRLCPISSLFVFSFVLVSSWMSSTREGFQKEASVEAHWAT
jgi:hypothetical protein